MEYEAVHPRYGSWMRDESGLEGNAQGVLLPRSIDELAGMMANAAREGRSLTVQGARTGLCGGAVPDGGLVLCLMQLDGMRLSDAFGEETLVAQAGASMQAIAALAQKSGHFFPAAPTEPSATIGGVYATGASGLYSLRYGAAARYVRALRWVTPQGAVWDIPRGKYIFDEKGCPLPNSSMLSGRALYADTRLPRSPVSAGIPRPGMDLIDLLVGSEGHLGVAAQLELELLLLPRALWGVVFFFEKDEALLRYTEWLSGWHGRQGAETLRCAEVFDEGALRLLAGSEAQSGLIKGLGGFPQGAHVALYVELDGGEEDALEVQLAELLDGFAQVGGNEADTWAESGETGVARLRALRHAVTELARPGAGAVRMETDYIGPAEKHGEYWRMYKQGLNDSGLRGVVYGHVLQNHMQVELLPRDAEQAMVAKELMCRWAAQVVRDGGQLAGGHGLGCLKRALATKFMPDVCKEHFAGLKSQLDPQGVMGL